MRVLFTADEVGVRLAEADLALCPRMDELVSIADSLANDPAFGPLHGSTWLVTRVVYRLGYTLPTAVRPVLGFSEVTLRRWQP